MKVGLIARSEDRGLGNLTWEWAQHMRPDRILLVVPNHSIPQRPERYDDPTVVRWNHRLDAHLDEQIVREWLDGLDVVYSAETFYDWRVCTWARESGVRTVCHVMPEFYRHGQPTPPVAAPDVWWTPTRWRLEHLDRATRVVPVPVAVERFARAKFHVEHSPTWLHVAGTKAMNDRNGTRIVLDALRHLTGEHHVRFRSQGEPIPRVQVGRHVHVDVVVHPVDEYWQLYNGEDMLVLPRRYAGLSLPALEAMGAGLGLLMSAVEPQVSEWPIEQAGAFERGHITTSTGRIDLAEVDPKVLARCMDTLAATPGAILQARLRAHTFARSQSWDALRPVIQQELERACVTS